MPTLGYATLQLTPNPLSSGLATIVITVTDPLKGVFTNVVTSNLVVNVGQVFASPILTPGFTGAQSVAAGNTVTLPFTVNTPNAGTTNLNLTATSGTASLIQNSGIVVVAPASGTGAGVWNVAFTAQSGVTGPDTINVLVVDNISGLKSSTQFLLNVTPAPDHLYSSGGKPIVITDVSPASPYPSPITVAGLNGVVGKVTVTLDGFIHHYPQDVGVLLVSPSGTNVVLMNRAGYQFSITNAVVTNGVNVTFDPNAAAAIPQLTAITNGTYKPADYWNPTGNTIPGSGNEFFPPAPETGYTTSLSSLVGTTPDGVWSLYVQDTQSGDAGVITGGWTLDITTLPVITGLGTVTVAENGSVSVPFTMADDSPSGPSFTWSFSSGSASLLPANNTNNVNVVPAPGDKTGLSFILTIAPGLNQFGTNTLTVTATDIDKLSSSQQITVKVPFSPQPPVAILAANQYWFQQGTLGTIPVVTNDPQGLPIVLSVVSSTNTTLLPVSAVNFVNGTNLVVGPFIGASGQTLLTIMAQETNGNLLSSTTSLIINVTPVANQFGNATMISIPYSPPSAIPPLTRGPGGPYPSQVAVSNVVGTIMDTKVTLLNFGHTIRRMLPLCWSARWNRKLSS